MPWDAIASFLGSVGTSVTNYFMNKKNNEANSANVDATNEANLAMNEATNKANKEINEANNKANQELQNTVNATNLQIAQETNDYNERMQREYNQAMSDMTAKTNETNKQIQESVNESNKAMQESANATNMQIATDTNNLNKAIADQNLAFQREQQDYEEALQKQIFEREDTSYQRTVADMKASGLNPLSMGGTNGSGAVVGRTASNNTMQYQGATVGASTDSAYQSILTQLAPPNKKELISIGMTPYQAREVSGYMRMNKEERAWQMQNNIAKDFAETLSSVANAMDTMRGMKSMKDKYGSTKDAEDFRWSTSLQSTEDRWKKDAVDSLIKSIGNGTVKDTVILDALSKSGNVEDVNMLKKILYAGGALDALKIFK